LARLPGNFQQIAFLSKVSPEESTPAVSTPFSSMNSTPFFNKVVRKNVDFLLLVAVLVFSTF
jgi:hypothetical protein